jgi:hypothetical protein
LLLLENILPGIYNKGILAQNTPINSSVKIYQQRIVGGIEKRGFADPGLTVYQDDNGAFSEWLVLFD